MALDEALLESVSTTPSVAVFRTYGWTVPTLSLGYFQKHAEAETDPLLSDTSLVRRPTGGGAIWHHRELTYALVVPRENRLTRCPVDLYRAVHGVISALVRTQGCSAERRGSTSGQSQGNRPFFCFCDRDPEDIVVQGAKIVGSAQRRRDGAVLQHGSLLLAHSDAMRELPGLSDLAAVPASPLFWSARMCESIPSGLAFDVRADEPARHELNRASILEQSVYRNSAWTRRR